MPAGRLSLRPSSPRTVTSDYVVFYSTSVHAGFAIAILEKFEVSLVRHVQDHGE